MQQPVAPKSLLLSMFRAAVSAADPATITPRFLPAPPRGRLVVLGAGKAAASMAKAVPAAVMAQPREMVLARVEK